MSGEVRVVLYHVASDVDGLEAAYRTASERLSDVPGLLDNQLLRSAAEPDRFVVASSWSSSEAFERWERGRDHKRQTEPLRPFRDTTMGRGFRIYRVIASF